MRRVDGKIEAVRHLPAFAGCSTADLTTICRLTELAIVSAGTSICVAGDPALQLHLVLDGMLDDGSSHRLGPGDQVGAVEMLDGGTYTTTVWAAVDTVLLVAGPKHFFSLVDRVDDFRRAILLGLAREVRTRRAVTWLVIAHPLSQFSLN